MKKLGDKLYLVVAITNIDPNGCGAEATIVGVFDDEDYAKKVANKELFRKYKVIPLILNEEKKTQVRL